MITCPTARRRASTRPRASPRARSGRRPRSGARAMPASAHAPGRPRLLITVATSGVVDQVAGLPHGEREDRHDLVAVDEGAGGSTARQRSASPSNAKPRSAPGATTAALQRLGVGRAAASLMLRPSGEALIAITSAPASRSACGPTSTGRAVRAVEDDLAARQRRVDGADEVLGVLLDGRAVRCHPADVAAERPVPVLADVRLDGAPRARRRACTPPRARNLMPLSGIGLCDAESTTPMSAPSAAVRSATAGVGSTRSRKRRRRRRPARRPRRARGTRPEVRESRPTTARGRCARCRASRRAPRARGAAATREVRARAPPSVTTVRETPDPVGPEQSRQTCGAAGSALAVLGSLAGLLETGLLALDDAGVTSQEAGLLQAGRLARRRSR